MARAEARKQGPPYYYQRVSVAEQNQRLRERLRRSKLDIEYVEAEKHELEDEVEQLRKENAELHHENDRLKSELGFLRQQLRPRSTQNPERKLLSEVRQERNEQPKKIGAKPGHIAHKRKVPIKIDRHVKIVPDHCPNCHGQLPEPSLWQSHTQIDLPEPVKLIVTQYHVGWSHCANCKQNVSIADSEKMPRSKYGPRLHALVGYWKFGMGLTLPKIQQMLIDQYDLEIGTGELSEILSNGAAKFFYPYQGLKDALKKEAVVYADETSWRRAGRSAWLWSFSSPKYSFYTIEKGRSKDVVKDVLGDKFDGILSSDFLGSYSAIECRKQKCWIHVLRKMKWIEKKYPDNPEVISFHRTIRRFYDRATALATKKKKHRDSIERSYKLLVAHTDSFAKKKWKLPVLNTMADRLKLHRDALYTFIKAEIDPHNNTAEREIRPAVLMRKTSYGNRSMRGAQTQAIWMSLIRTCHKQSKPFMKTASDYITVA